jgi:hypothetical protein
VRAGWGTRSIIVVGSVAAFAPASALAGTVVGQAPPVAGSPTPCSADYSFIGNTVSSGPSYVVPAPGGVITEWRHEATGAAGERAALRVFVRSPASSDFIVLAESESEEVAPPGLNRFPTRLPAPTGSQIGLRTATSMWCGHATDAGDSYFSETPPRPVGALQSAAAQFSGLRLNVAAVVEPDADRDLFGDETQDGCPTVATVQTDCVAPQTTLTRKPRKRWRKRRARFEFVASEPGSTFECRLDSGPPTSCTSPFAIARLKRRQHAFEVTAIDALGNRDPAPAQSRFTVLARKRR